MQGMENVKYTKKYTLAHRAITHSGEAYCMHKHYHFVHPV